MNRLLIFIAWLVHIDNNIRCAEQDTVAQDLSQPVKTLISVTLIFPLLVGFDDDSGLRQTQVENKLGWFVPPELTLSQYLDRKH